MTRIVGGAAKGRRLTVPASGTRPTSERAREALFNTLRAHLDIEGATVLDLFAGTGAVGLEALSRGAARVVFVEADKATSTALHRNIEAVGLPGTRMYRRPVDAILTGLTSEAFDLVFADPPYAYDDLRLAELLALLVTRDWLVDGGLVVVERAARGDEPSWPQGIDLVTSKRYGEGVLWYGRRQP